MQRFNRSCWRRRCAPVPRRLRGGFSIRDIRQSLHCVGYAFGNVDGRGEIAGRIWSNYMDPASGVRTRRLSGVRGSAREWASEESHPSDWPQRGVREAVRLCGGRRPVSPTPPRLTDICRVAIDRYGEDAPLNVAARTAVSPARATPRALTFG